MELTIHVANSLSYDDEMLDQNCYYEIMKYAKIYFIGIHSAEMYRNWKKTINLL